MSVTMFMSSMIVIGTIAIIPLLYKVYKAHRAAWDKTVLILSIPLIVIMLIANEVLKNMLETATPYNIKIIQLLLDAIYVLLPLLSISAGLLACKYFIEDPHKNQTKE